VALGCNRWQDGTVAPDGVRYLESFSLANSVAQWRYRVGPNLISKSVWMEPGHNCTYAAYRLEQAIDTVTLELVILACLRGSTEVLAKGGRNVSIETQQGSVRIGEGQDALVARLSRGVVTPGGHTWYEGFQLGPPGCNQTDDAVEGARGSVELRPGDEVVLSLSTPAQVPAPRSDAAQRRQNRDARLAPLEAKAHGLGRRLRLAADGFLARRADQSVCVIPELGGPSEPHPSKSALIALPGLTLYANRPSDCGRILQSIIPAPGDTLRRGDDPDWGLWLIEAAQQYFNVTGDIAQLSRWQPGFRAIIDWYLSGSIPGLSLHPDGLLSFDQPMPPGGRGVQLSDRTRSGKLFDINTLWVSGLMFLTRLSQLTGEDEAETQLGQVTKLATDNLDRFWDEPAQAYRDALDCPGEPTAASVIALSLAGVPFHTVRARRALKAVLERLYTPAGLRFGPDSKQAASWLIPRLSLVVHRAHGSRKRARELLAALADNLSEGTRGYLDQHVDSAPPHEPIVEMPTAAPVAETLRALFLLGL